MSGAEVLEQLERYEELSRDRGAIGADKLRPGLTLQHIRMLEDKHGLRLSEDAKAVWSWHDGVGGAVGSPKIRFWWGSQFLDLESAISHGKLILDIRNEGDTIRCPGATWVTLAQSTISSVIDITNPDLPDSAVLISDPTAAPDEYPIVSVAKRIWWWNWGIENDVQYVGDDGQWFPNLDNYPTGPERHLV